MDKKKYLIIIGGILFIMLVLIIFNINNITNLSPTQKEDILKEGNEFYDKSQYENSLSRYNALLFQDSLYYPTEYNKASTYCKKKRYDLADSTYKKGAFKYAMANPDIKEKTEDEFLSKTFHNKGNTNMKQVTTLDTIIMIGEELKNKSEQPNAGQDASYQADYKKLAEYLTHVQTAVDDYKNSLRMDSKNDSTRFNLAYAQEYEKRLLDILKDITPPDNQNQQNQQNQNKDQQNQNQQDQQDQQNQNQNDKEDERKDTDQKNGEKDQNADLSKENAEQILKAMEKDEENTLKKVRLQRDKNQQRKRIEKNW